MKLQDIQLGTRMELELLDKNYESTGNTYVSQLLELQQDNLLMISAPIYEARLVYVSIDSQLRLTFVHYKYGLIGFTATVVKNEHRGQVAVLIIKPDSELVKIQRRTYFRLDYLANILVWPEAEDCQKKMDKQGEKAAIKAVTRNISGSGLCIISETELPKNSEVDIEIDLAGMIIKSRCLVIRSNKLEINKGKRFETGLHFLSISKKDQDYLIKYIFEQQRLLLKRESQ